MTNLRKVLIRAAILCATLVLAACGAGTSTGGNTGNTPPAHATATTAATATPAKPTSLPPVTMAFCQQIMSLADANQIMQPAQAATLIEVTPTPSGGVCTYRSSTAITGIVLSIPLATYSGARPIPQQQIEDYFKAGLNAPGVTVLSVTPVSGVGDQAGIAVGSYSIEGTTIYGAAFFELFGNVVFDCGELYQSSPTTAQQSQLKQCAQHVVGAL